MEFLYPTCPTCENKASEGNGVALQDLPTVRWYCPECGYIHTGTFHPGDSDIQWDDSPRKANVVDRLKRSVTNVL